MPLQILQNSLLLVLYLGEKETGNKQHHTHTKKEKNPKNQPENHPNKTSETRNFFVFCLLAFLLFIDQHAQQADYYEN